MNSVLDKLQIEIYGGSHEKEVGAVCLGFKKGDEISLSALNRFMDRRKANNNCWSTPRLEDDIISFNEGASINGDKVILNGSKLNISILNENIKPNDYNNVKLCPRPSHSDYVAYVRDGVIPSGGGRFSGRMTAPICVIGGICKQLLEKRGVTINAYISEIGTMKLGSYKTGDVYESNNSDKFILPLIDKEAEPEVIKYIEQVQRDNDSVGGIVECVVDGVNAGDIGDNLFGSIEAKLAYGVTSIPAIRGIEFGEGFDITKEFGSMANDPFIFEGDVVKTVTNKSGGINGGISNGNPITFAVAIRPTPSIRKPQMTVDLNKKTSAILEIRGRHDACILPRIVPCVEAVASIIIYEEYIKREGNN